MKAEPEKDLKKELVNTDFVLVGKIQKVCNRCKSNSMETSA